MFLVISVVGIIYTYKVDIYNIYSSLMTTQIDGKADIGDGEHLKGNMLLKLSPLEADINTKDTYILNVDNYKKPAIVKSPLFTSIDYSFIDILDNKKALFVRNLIAGGNKINQIFISTTEENSPLPKTGTTVQVTNSNVSKYFPSVNSNGDLLYFAKTNKVANYSYADAWSVYLKKNTSTTSELLVNGAYPRWVSGNMFIYVTSDGLHVYNTENNNDELILGLESGKGLINVHIAVSPNKKLLAVSYPDANVLQIFNIDNWSEPKPVSVSEVKARVFWPTFSPDSKFLAVHRVTDVVSNIEIYRIRATGASKLDWNFDLNLFNTGSVLITDWY